MTPGRPKSWARSENRASATGPFLARTLGEQPVIVMNSPGDAAGNSYHQRKRAVEQAWTELLAWTVVACVAMVLFI